ncbi:hypothetical protein GN958_ATG05227 [Phytophthora infestans]|uniref:Uncharacterized protein n=1 Tax=Phytophthora infestans TaxID=4787 RepID=A0A8S9UY21_PHYIN|nr:hypothetical protein GN958_ATG05227 [Phytophthora infestans]
MTLRRALLKEQKVAKALTTIMHKRPSTPHSVMHETRGASCSQSDATTQLSQCSHCCNTTTLHINPATVRWANYDDNADKLHIRSRCEAAGSKGPRTSLEASRSSWSTLRPDPGDVSEQQFTVEAAALYQTVLLDGFGSTRQSDDGNQRLILWAAVWSSLFPRMYMARCSSFTLDPANKSFIQFHHSVAAEKAAGCTVIDGEHIDNFAIVLCVPWESRSKSVI